MTAPTRKPRIILAHDWLVGRRGGELVLDAIIRALEPTTHVTAILTLFDDGQPITRAIDDLPRHAVFTGHRALKLRRHLLPLYPRAAATLSRELARRHADNPFDLLISTHSAAIKSIKPPPGLPHLCYCHTPARYIWSQTSQYGSASIPLALIRPLYKAWDRRTARRVSTFLANSTHTAEEVRRCYRAQSHVVFPPVRTRFFTPADERTDRTTRGTHWLAAGALVPYKRFDLAIAAANMASHPLTIVGTGPELDRLKRLAGPTVTFAHADTDNQMRDHYRRARLLIQPQLEDFGITALEAQACGTPVVAFAKGGARDTVKDDATGALFHHQSTDALLAAIDRCPKHHALACREHAESFSEAAFTESFLPHARALFRART
ncbi:MAG: glycosyltransferase [Planctomycetota bacterium]